jgi:acetoacetyl-CoA synthetase
VTAELYSIIDKLTSTEDSIAVGQHRPIDKDERVLLFVKMMSICQFDDRLEGEIRTAIRTALSAWNVPDALFLVAVKKWSARSLTARNREWQEL